MTTQELQRHFDKEILFLPGACQDLPFTRIELLDDQKLLLPHVLYLGSYKKFSQLCSDWKIEPAVSLLISDVQDRQIPASACTFPEGIMVSPLSQESLFNRIHVIESQQPPSLTDIWEQIMTRRLLSAEDIRDALLPANDNPTVYLQQLLLRPEDGSPGIQPSQVQELFPDGIIIPYQKGIIILRLHTNQLFRFPLPDALETWLIDHKCILCVGNATRDFSMIRTNALLLFQTCRLGRILRQPNQRILLLGDYQLMIMIDNCVKEFIRQHGHFDICYLAHPALIHIIRYDRCHQSNLQEVLYRYLSSGGNVKLTAEMLYMHHNTVLNKLKKIHELLDLDLTDSLLRQHLLLSCQLLEYQEKILKQPLNWEKKYD